MAQSHNIREKVTAMLGTAGASIFGAGTVTVMLYDGTQIRPCSYTATTCSLTMGTVAVIVGTNTGYVSGTTTAIFSGYFSVPYGGTTYKMPVIT